MALLLRWLLNTDAMAERGMLRCGKKRYMPMKAAADGGLGRHVRMPEIA
ncbi:hypothetical protein [Acinetobacter sp. WCHAc010034]|nr:hypothetical protein [Acinetobacter sp. WCHAc010034]